MFCYCTTAFDGQTLVVVGLGGAQRSAMPVMSFAVLMFMQVTIFMRVGIEFADAILRVNKIDDLHVRKARMPSLTRISFHNWILNLS